MANIDRFNTTFRRLISEMTNTSGGTGSVFSPTGTVNDGQYGNQFPSQNDNAYAPGDARNMFGWGKKKKKKKILVQRRAKG